MATNVGTGTARGKGRDCMFEFNSLAIQGHPSMKTCGPPTLPTISNALPSTAPEPLPGPSNAPEPVPGPSTPKLPIDDSSSAPSPSSSSSASSAESDSSEHSFEESSALTSESISSPESASGTTPITYKLVGDNIDKNVRPREMRSDVQTRSLHYFHTYAVRDRVDMSQFSGTSGNVDFGEIRLQEILPTCRDEVALRDNFAILVGRVLAKYMPFFATLAKGLERHIPHDFSAEMSQKSEVVNC